MAPAEQGASIALQGLGYASRLRQGYAEAGRWARHAVPLHGRDPASTILRESLIDKLPKVCANSEEVNLYKCTVVSRPIVSVER